MPLVAWGAVDLDNVTCIEVVAAEDQLTAQCAAADTDFTIARWELAGLSKANHLICRGLGERR